MKSLKTSALSKKGQTTIPREIREKLNIKEGDSILFEVKKDGQILLKKAPSLEDLEYLTSIEKTLAPEWLGDDDDDL